MMPLVVPCAFVLTVVLSACAHPVVHNGAPHARVASRSTLAPGDLFTVRVFGETELSGDFRVQDNGTIDFPYLSAIRVSGLSTSETAALIERLLRERAILRDPHVSVLVGEMSGRRIAVLGQVAHPGTFSRPYSLTITQVIAEAGGFTPLAAQNQVRVRRRLEDGRQGYFVVHVRDIFDGRENDFELLPGDVIFVPESMA